MKITLVIPRVSRGGATISTLALAGALAIPGTSFTLVILGESSTDLEQEARAAGIRVIRHDQTEDAGGAIAEADLVHVQFWNTPAMYEWLRASQPPMRLLMTLHVAGDCPAQVISQPLLEFADWIAPTTAYTLELPAFQNLNPAQRARARVILPTSSKPTADVAVPPHSTIRIGYAGTVDFVKLHPRFIELCTGVQAVRAQFPVAGAGAGYKTLRRQAEALGASERFEWLGFLTEIFRGLATFDVLGYPIRRETYATSDLILQEAMWIGVPPVILGHGALPYLIQDGVNGIVARDTSAYVQALNFLCDNKAERLKLGSNARAYAREHFGSDKSALQLSALYDEAMQLPKRERAWQHPTAPAPFQGAHALIESFGTQAAPYLKSLTATTSAEYLSAEQEIANASPSEVNAWGGGILDYSRAYPQDAMLRLWAGLALGQQRRFALAAGEFYAAEHLGLDKRRVQGYLERVMQQQLPFEDESA